MWKPWMPSGAARTSRAKTAKSPRAGSNRGRDCAYRNESATCSAAEAALGGGHLEAAAAALQDCSVTYASNLCGRRHGAPTWTHRNGCGSPCASSRASGGTSSASATGWALMRARCSGRSIASSASAVAPSTRSARARYAPPPPLHRPHPLLLRRRVAATPLSSTS